MFRFVNHFPGSSAMACFFVCQVAVDEVSGEVTALVKDLELQPPISRNVRQLDAQLDNISVSESY